MTSAQWQQVKQIVADALDAAPEQRSAFIETCDDEDVRQEVQSLLASYEQAEAEEVMNTSVFGPIQDRPSEAVEGRRIGAYQLVRLIGRGGMGAVYLAERADGQFTQRAALKVIDRSFPGAELRRRFLSERNILARLQHPNIALLLDGGVTTPATGEEDGLPYLVMEYVEGVPITQYCEAHALSVEERLRLFLQVCDAVQYAHRNLVVHRDLKPGNVLVVEREGRAQAKLLDFGIAKLLSEDENEDDAPLTRTGMRVLTPECAAPEQLRGEVVTTAADVYALGVLLYEMLTGRRPYALRGLTAAEIERVVCDTEPARPSAALPDDAAPGVEAVAAITRLQRQLRGDLDQIILKALRKEPDRRYASAEAMADDVRRHLNGLPVAARPDTLRYRAAKFTRRHRFGVGAALLVLLVLVGGIAATTVQARRAEAEAAKATSLNTFLLEMLAAADPEKEGREVTVAELLDAAVEEADRSFRGQPAIEAAVRHTLGNTYVALGLFDEGEAQLRQALALRERLHGHQHPDVAETQVGLANARRRQGLYEEADSLYQRALATTRAHYGNAHEKTAARLNDAGVNLWEKGEYEAAEPFLREGLALEERLRGPEHEEVAVSLGNLATLLADQGKEAEAEPMYRRQLDILRATHGDDHVKIALALTQLGVLRHDLGHVAEADSLHTLALAMYRKLQGNEHPDVAFALNNLATTKIDLGAFDEAERLQQEALTTLRAAVGEIHPNVGIQLNNMASTRSSRGDLPGAEAAYEEAVSVWRASLPPNHPYLAYGLHNVGAVRLRQDRVADAEAPLREALSIREEALPPDHEHTLITESMLGDCLARLGRRAEAERHLVHAYEGLRAKLGETHARTLEAAERLVDFYRATGRTDAAAQLTVSSDSTAGR